MKKLPYDETSSEDILRYAEELIGLSFLDVLANVFEDDELCKMINYYNNPRSKGGLGTLIEEFYFFYKPNSDSEADFSKANTELKVTPYEKTKTGKTRAGERLVITMIPNDRPIADDFEMSHLRNKISKILMVWYERIKNINRTEYNIDYVNLYDLYSEVCAKDLAIICNDYNTIANKIISGKAHELSEGDTKYLGACTKGSTAQKSLQPQFYNSKIKAKRRAFSLKQSYMTYVFNNYVKTGVMNYDSIFTKDELVNNDFDEFIINKIYKFKNKSENELYKEFDIYNMKNSKQINKTLVYRILGVKTDNAEEFEKANIVIKTIRVKKNGVPRESMSFPSFKIRDFIKQDFENSKEYNYFQETRFLFVVFKENNKGVYTLKGARFWNMPMSELESTFKCEWEAYKNKFVEGVNFTMLHNKNNDIIMKNDLPKKKETQILHLRPHSSKSAYVINGKKYGNGTDKDMDILPNGDKMTKQCFWLNNDYIAEIIKEI